MDDMTGLDVWQLRRDPDDRVLGGVCSALAARLDVDVLLVRVAAVVAGLGAGVGAVAYAWAWLVLPQRGARTSLLERWLPETATWSRGTHLKVGSTVAILAALLLALVVPWSMGPAFVLVVLVVLGRRLHTDPVAEAHPLPVAGPAVAPDSDFGRAVAAWQARVAEVSRSLEAPAVEAGIDLAALPAPRLQHDLPSATAAPVGDRRGSRRHAWLTGCCWLVLAGLVAAAVRRGNPSMVLTSGVVCGVLVLGLLVAALTGRRRPRLVLPALVAVLVTLACVPWAPNSTNGRTEVHQVASAAQLPDGVQRINASHITWDLTGLDATGATPLDLETTASYVEVIVPRSMAIHVDYELQGSVLDIEPEGSTEHLVGFARASWPDTPAEDGPVLDLTLTARASTVVVRHA